MTRAANKRPRGLMDMASAAFWVTVGFALIFGMMFASVYVVRLAWRLGGGG